MDLSSLYHLLTHADWQSNFDARTLARGNDYAQRGHVFKLQAGMDDDAHYVLLGRISGSGHKVYDCRIVLEAHDAWLTVDTDCSCPVGVDCKHAAAMLFDAMELGASALTAATEPPMPLVDRVRSYRRARGRARRSIITSPIHPDMGVA